MQYEELPRRQFVIGHSGYKPCELYVKRKYQTFKEEILNYKHFGLSGAVIGMKKAMKKASNYISTQQAKAMKYQPEQPTFYDIGHGAPISKDHLLSLILYTDFDQLSANFTSSFRKTNVFESFHGVKNRNSCYWWWSKSLREIVEGYGIKSDPFKRNRLCCFTGMSQVMIVPQFFITLNSPTSTSRHLEVADKFSGDDGMIIQIDQYWAPAIDCAWISKFKEEAEMYVHFFCVFMMVET